MFLELPVKNTPDRLRVEDGSGCAVCQRKVNEATAVWIHLTAYGAIPADAEYDHEASDQGWYPLGPDCAKLIPAAYRSR